MPGFKGLTDKQIAELEDQRIRLMKRFALILKGHGWVLWRGKEDEPWTQTWSKTGHVNSTKLEFDQIGFFVWQNLGRVAGFAWDPFSTAPVNRTDKIDFYWPPGFNVVLKQRSENKRRKVENI